MSVEYKAKVILGWRITDQQYTDLLNSDMLESYAKCADQYCGTGPKYFAQELASTENDLVLDAEDIYNSSCRDVWMEDQLCRDYCIFMGINWDYDADIPDAHVYLLLEDS